MAKGINKVILVGNLGQEPETKTFPDGGQITNISIATSEQWKDKQTGQDVERTEWHRVVFRGGLAGVAAQYLRKGSKIYVEGSLRTTKYQDKQTGQDRYSTDIMAREMQMLDSVPANNQPQQQPVQSYGSPGHAPVPQHQPQQQTYQQQPQNPYPNSTG